MKIALVQFSPFKGDIERNKQVHEFWINKAMEMQANLVVFPELSLTGYEPSLAAQLASNQNDVRLDVFQQLANEGNISICVGLPTNADGKLHISMIIFQPHKERITYSKQYLYPTEVDVFTAAHNPLVLDIEEERIAPAICYELSNAPHHENAVKNNATVYVASVLNSVSGVDADLQKLSILARNHNMFAFMANYIGLSGGYQCAGKSTVWDKDGTVLGQLSDREEGILLCDTEQKTVAINTIPNANSIN